MALEKDVAHYQTLHQHRNLGLQMDPTANASMSNSEPGSQSTSLNKAKQPVASSAI